MRERQREGATVAICLMIGKLAVTQCAKLLLLLVLLMLLLLLLPLEFIVCRHEQTRRVGLVTIVDALVDMVAQLGARLPTVHGRRHVDWLQATGSRVVSIQSHGALLMLVLRVLVLMVVLVGAIVGRYVVAHEIKVALIARC